MQELQEHGSLRSILVLGLRVRELVPNFVIFVLSLLLYVVMTALEDAIVKPLFRKDLFLFLNVYISWSSIRMFFLGIALGLVILIFLPLFSYFVAFELNIERFFGRNIVILNLEPKLTLDRIIVYGYILFAPIVILTRVLVALKPGDMFNYYIFIGEIAKQFLWIVLIILVTPYILVDKSRIRYLDKKKLLLKYPSLLMTIIAVLILGAGSIISLAPMYYDLLTIFRDELLTLELFLYAIGLFYLPSLASVIGYMLGLIILGKRVFVKAINTLENKTKGIKINVEFMPNTTK